MEHQATSGRGTRGNLLQGQRIAAVLHLAGPGRPAHRRVIAGQHRDHALDDDRPASTSARTKCTVQPCKAHAGRERAGVGVAARGTPAAAKDGC